MDKNIKLTKKDRISVWWRSFFLQGSWNYERMQNGGWAYSLIPAIKKLYKTKEERSAALTRHLEFFNTHPYVASPIIGVTLALEEERANGAPVDDVTIQGVKYCPNMPTEECYTSPDRFSAEGVVYATKPLSVMGNLIFNFGFRFKNGKVVEVLGDEKAKVVLEKVISIDEGASYLGEVALVPYDSPINQTGLLFYNTLFDENACCHLAIGAGFEDTIKNFDQLSKEELKAVGLNDSMIHVDFMIGAPDLDIKATTFTGQVVQIFKNGTWAF